MHAQEANEKEKSATCHQQQDHTRGRWHHLLDGPQPNEHLDEWDIRLKSYLNEEVTNTYGDISVSFDFCDSIARKITLRK